MPFLVLGKVIFKGLIKPSEDQGNQSSSLVAFRRLQVAPDRDSMWGSVLNQINR